nr:transposase [Bradyrhizobium zhanjiangense]
MTGYGVADDAVAIRARVIERLQAVYAIEAEIRGSSAEQRLAARRARSAPLMTALRARLTVSVVLRPQLWGLDDHKPTEATDRCRCLDGR